MNYKNIDTKMKEVYFDTKQILNDDIESETYETNFWKSMDMIAIQNLTFQKLMAA